MYRAILRHLALVLLVALGCWAIAFFMGYSAWAIFAAAVYCGWVLVWWFEVWPSPVLAEPAEQEHPKVYPDQSLKKGVG